MRKNTAMFVFATALLIAGCSGTRSATQANDGAWVLYAGLIKTQGYVVGSALANSGLHVLSGNPESEFEWWHIGWNTPRISGISVDPNNANTMYLAGGNGVLRSFDAGASWKIVTGWQVTEVQDVAVDPSRPDEVYLASAYGIWSSKDAGDTWAEASAGITRRFTQTIEVDANSPGRVLAGTELGIFLSENGGSNWRRVGPEGVDVLDIQQSVSRPDSWIAVAEAAGIWLSADDGKTWVQAPGTDGLSFYSAAIDPGNANNMAATGWETTVWLTRDGGSEWTRIGADFPTPSGYELAFDRNVAGRLWFATLEEGVYFTDDFGGTWSSADLHGTLVFDMLFVRP